MIKKKEVIMMKSTRMINNIEVKRKIAIIVTKKRIKKKITIGKNQKIDITKNIEKLIDMREEGAKRILNIKIKKIDQKTMIQNIKIVINMTKNIKKKINIVQDIYKMTITKNMKKEKKIMKKINLVTNKEMIIIDTDQFLKVDLDLILRQKMKTNKKQ